MRLSVRPHDKLLFDSHSDADMVAGLSKDDRERMRRAQVSKAMERFAAFDLVNPCMWFVYGKVELRTRERTVMRVYGSLEELGEDMFAKGVRVRIYETEGLKRGCVVLRENERMASEWYVGRIKNEARTRIRNIRESAGRLGTDADTDIVLMLAHGTKEYRSGGNLREVLE